MLAVLSLSLSLAAGGAPVGVHTFQVKANDGAEVSLAKYAGKALLIVNTASECGYTPQYKGLEELYQAYRARGLEVLAFPSNDFGRQEPGTDAEIKTFCERRYKTTFPLFAKLPVKGKAAAPLFVHLAAEGRGEPTWNFNKYLVDPAGKVVAHLESDVEPMSAELRKRIEAVLPAK